MANTSARMLRLLSLLQTHRHWPGLELADRLAVSERTLRRDIDRLRELGYPVHSGRGSAGGYQLRSGTVMPPLLLDDEEAVAIAVGLRTAAGGTVEGMEETALRALTKVVQVMPPRLRRRVDALRAYTVTAPADGPRIDAVTLTVIAQACRDDERLTFTYAAPSGEAASRLVEPHRLVSFKRRWYLVAWDLGRADWRVFRLDRLTGPAVTGARFRPRDLPAADAAAFVQERLGARPARYDITVLLHAPADTVERVVAVTGGRVEPVDDRSCHLRLQVDAFDWPVLILAAVGAEFDVIDPPEFRRYLRDVGRLFLRAGG
ncbi:YafY family protein [Spongiactinospora sp. TRM90649]|uniref:helix-turn-helix transcriptional regulator n=1 Tax=Spongiactinospora sp. TRM90649 TaxID=3031114 RepID=UPI0023F83FA3|nr:YafY family protein [Spongiactinospora sp. TRM90649]MDF5757645.1 YafY family protein [Spongiactinospora sp. TRM90649]